MKELSYAQKCRLLREAEYRRYPEVLAREIAAEQARAAWGDPMGIRCLTDRWGRRTGNLTRFDILPKPERRGAERDADHPLHLPFDHSELWVPKIVDAQRPWRLAAITFHPYRPNGVAADEGEWAALLSRLTADHGLIVRVLPPAESWYAPGLSMSVQIVRPEVWAGTLREP